MFRHQFFHFGGFSVAAIEGFDDEVESVVFARLIGCVTEFPEEVREILLGSGSHKVVANNHTETGVAQLCLFDRFIEQSPCALVLCNAGNHLVALCNSIDSLIHLFPRPCAFLGRVVTQL